jgi:hypothetical protein
MGAASVTAGLSFVGWWSPADDAVSARPVFHRA